MFWQVIKNPIGNLANLSRVTRDATPKLRGPNITLKESPDALWWVAGSSLSGRETPTFSATLVTALEFAPSL
ncbi:hypothetical protein [Acetomicrobium sp.]|uniref:hypothetical protein n=1 Tax=Acetomicrobium sp. TaxID=1872099 RepID=UPI002FCB8C50